MGGVSSDPVAECEPKGSFRPPGWRTLPPLARAFFRYAVRTRDPGLIPVTMLQREVDTEIDEFTTDLFGDVEMALRAGVEERRLERIEGATAVRFDYDTRLLLPAMLTHGRLHVLAGNLPVARLWRSVDDTDRKSVV